MLLCAWILEGLRAVLATRGEDVGCGAPQMDYSGLEADVSLVSAVGMLDACWAFVNVAGATGCRTWGGLARLRFGLNCTMTFYTMSKVYAHATSRKCVAECVLV